MPDIPELDGQDGAEAYDALLDDETGQSNLEGRTFEELPDVEDLTQLAGDRDDDEAVALDATEFDPDAIGDDDLEDDNELAYRAADAEREDDVDGQGEEQGEAPPLRASSEIEGLEVTADADLVEGGEDDFTNFESKSLDDADLQNLGYSRDRKTR